MDVLSRSFSAIYSLSGQHMGAKPSPTRQVYSAGQQLVFPQDEVLDGQELDRSAYPPHEVRLRPTIDRSTGCSRTVALTDTASVKFRKIFVVKGGD